LCNDVGYKVKKKIILNRGFGQALNVVAFSTFSTYLWTTPSTKPNQTKPNQTKPNQTKPNQTKPNQTKPNQTKKHKDKPKNNQTN
jgi:hypothetical protein